MMLKHTGFSSQEFRFWSQLLEFKLQLFVVGVFLNFPSLCLSLPIYDILPDSCEV